MNAIETLLRSSRFRCLPVWRSRAKVQTLAEVDSRDNSGWTPLHYASYYGHLEVARVLVDHGADINTRQLYHYTPVHLSAETGYLGIVKLLLEHGADFHGPTSHGQTPYQLSLAYGHREIANLLREHGAGSARFEEIFFLILMRCLIGPSILVLSESAE